MVQTVYEKGIIKVVWLGSDQLRIYSRMFDDLEEAKQFAKSKKDCLVFSLLKQKKMKDFDWKLLPLGEYRLYKLAIRLYQKYGNKLVKLLKL